MPSRAMTAGESTDIEQTVRQVVGDVLNDMSDELSSPSGEPPTNGRSSRALTSRSGRGTPGRPSPGLPPDGDEAVPPEVAEAIDTVLQDLSPQQAQALASLFEAMGEQGEGEEEEDGRPGAMSGTGIGAAGAELELGSTREAKSQGQVAARSGWRVVLKLIRKSYKVYKAAVRSAKGGKASYNRWVNSLSNWNPAKWAIKALPSAAYWELYDFLASQSERAAGARATAGETDSEEIEQVVRRVLSEALTEAQGGAPAH